MALKGPSCIVVEQKRDFDLSIVLEALGNVMCKEKDNTRNSNKIVDKSDLAIHAKNIPGSLLDRDINSHIGSEDMVDVTDDTVQHAGLSEAETFSDDYDHHHHIQDIIGFTANPEVVSKSMDFCSHCYQSLKTVSTSTVPNHHICNIKITVESPVEESSTSNHEMSMSEYTLFTGSGLFTSPTSSAEPTADNTLTYNDECNDLRIEEYLRGFTELTRFFKLTGPVFAFVARDLAKKIYIVQSHMSSSQGSNYVTLKQMIDYEMKMDIIGRKGANASGTRTMLRLHWALEFFIKFMDQLRDASNDTKTSTLVYDIYQQTLATHHPWWTRKLAYLAVFTLPPIRTLIDIMCKQEFDEVKVLLSKVVAVGKPILDHTRSLYQSYNISNIP